MVPFPPSTQQSMADEEDKDRDTADCQGNVSLSVSFLELQSESRAGEGCGDASLWNEPFHQAGFAVRGPSVGHAGWPRAGSRQLPSLAEQLVPAG